MSKMWIYGEDMQMEGNVPKGSLVPVVFTSYYKNADGSYLTDSFNAGTINYYPKSGYVQLVSDKAQWPARFKVPIMDSFGGGNFEQDAWLTLDWANAKKTSDTIQEVPIKDALKELLEIKNTAIQVQYTAESWSALEAAYDVANALYNNDKASTEELTGAYTSLRTAIDGLEDVKAPELSQGVYTATGQLDSTDCVTDVRFLVGDDNKKSDIYLTTKDVTEFEYYDVEEKEYKKATAKKDADGNVTGFEFGLSEMAASVSVQYKNSDGKTKQGILVFSDMTKQDIDKETLKATLELAQTKLDDAKDHPENYDSKAIADLQTAVAEATEVYKNPVALQNELDDQNTAVNGAVDALAKSDSLKKLNDAIAKADEVNAELYTQTSYNSFKTVLDQAKALAESENPTVSAMDQMILDLNVAKKALIEKASDWTAFDTQYEKAIAITNDAQYPGWRLSLNRRMQQMKALQLCRR